MTDNEQTTNRGEAEGDKAFLADRVVGVGTSGRKRVAENGGCFFEGNPVLGQVVRRFLRPLKAQASTLAGSVHYYCPFSSSSSFSAMRSAPARLVSSSR